MRKNEAKWYDSAKRWQIKIQKDGERRTFFSSTKETKGKIAAEKAADAWLENGLASESTKCGELLDAYFGHISKSTSKSNANQQENFVKKLPETGDCREENQEAHAARLAGNH